MTVVLMLATFIVVLNCFCKVRKWHHKVTHKQVRRIHQRRHA